MNIQKALNHLKQVDPRMGKLIYEFGPPAFNPESNYFDALVRAIVYQQLSGKAANTIYNRFLDLFKNENPPTPKEILSQSHESLRRVGLSNQKAAYIRDLSEKWDSGEVDLRGLDSRSDEDIAAELIKVKGIGQWTADMFLMFTINRPDVFPLGDLGIQKGYKGFYNMDKLPTADEMAQGAEIWKPYRTVAAWYLWKIVDGPFEW